MKTRIALLILASVVMGLAAVNRPADASPVVGSYPALLRESVPASSGAPLIASGPVVSHPADRKVPDGGAPLPTQDPGELESAAFGGTATWYCGNGSACTAGYGPSDLVAAIDPSLGIDKGTRLTVRHNGRAVTVKVVDVCACSGARVIDLTSGAFSRLASLSEGVIDVSITGAAANPTPPSTDLELP